MKICNLASGSSGNSTIVSGTQTSILVDCGISKKYLDQNLDLMDIATPDAILITHEHIDHISGLGVISRKYKLPIYLTEKTLADIRGNIKLGKIDTDLFNIIYPDRDFRIGDIDILPFSISHDANDPVAFRFNKGQKSIAIATDMGEFNDYTISNLRGVDSILIEANHDVSMLELGEYPWNLKKRILGNKGHLSNEDSAKLLSQIIEPNIKHILLGHLSTDNNLAELARITIHKTLKLIRKDIDINNVKIEVAHKNKK